MKIRNLSPLFDLTGKVTVVTGASGGLGSAMVRGLLGCGAVVVGADIAEPSPGDGTSGAFFHRTDVTRKAEVDDLVDFTCREHGRIDIMIANAAFPGGAAAENETEDGFDRVMAVNAKGVFLCAQSACRRMIESGGGVIINVASALSFIGHPTCVAYTSSKGAVLQMTRTMAIEWAKFNIRVNCIAPGFYRTQLNSGLMSCDEYMKPILAKIPQRRIADPDEIIGTVIYMVSDASRFMTGSCVTIDGGELAAGGYTDDTIPFIYGL